MATQLTNTDPALARAVAGAVSAALRLPYISVAPYHTGGGIMVLAIDLSQDDRGLGRQAWLTREGDGWMLGVYDFAADQEDEGVCVGLFLPTGAVDDPMAVAVQVGRLFSRLGVTLQG